MGAMMISAAQVQVARLLGVASDYAALMVVLALAFALGMITATVLLAEMVA